MTLTIVYPDGEKCKSCRRYIDYGRNYPREFCCRCKHFPHRLPDGKESYYEPISKTLTIVNHYTHEKTFTVVGEPNGAVKILEEKKFHLNPRIHDDEIHDDANLPPLFFPDSRSDGSAAGPSSAPDSEEVCPMPLREREPGSSDFLEDE